MTKDELDRLRALNRKLDAAYKRAIVECRRQYLHADKNGAGAERWMEVHRLGGEADGLMHAYGLISDLIYEFTKEDEALKQFNEDLLLGHGDGSKKGKS